MSALRASSNPRGGARQVSSLQTRHYRQALDLVNHVSLEEGVIVSDRHAAIRIAIRPEHEAVCE
jgi:hypothetical protein